MANNNLLNENDTLYIVNSLNSLIDTTQDFTDSLHISNDQRERILQCQHEIKNKTLANLKKHEEAPNESDLLSKSTKSPQYQNLQFKSSTVLADCEALKKLLQSQTMLLSNSLFRQNEDATLLSLVKSYVARDGKFWFNHDLIKGICLSHMLSKASSHKKNMEIKKTFAT